MRASNPKDGKKIRNELTEEQKNEIRDAFESFEKDGIEPSELKLAMKALGFDPKSEEVQRIMSMVEAKGDKPINYEEFLDIMVEKPGKPEVEMTKAFNILCDEDSDKITLKSLKKMALELGENITDEELQEMITEADNDQDQVVGFEDFKKIMSKANMF